MVSPRILNGKGRSSTVLEKARQYVAAGLSLVPVHTDGSKQPAWHVLPQEWDDKEQRLKHVWKPFQQRLPTHAELALWYTMPAPAGLATIGGQVSGGLEILDFDLQAEQLYPAWCELVQTEAPDLLDKLCVVQTPREPVGYHVRYRVPGFPIPGNTPLAKADGKTLIETRGEGGYALAPGSPLACHASGRPYQHIAGPTLTQLANLTPDERAFLIRCAASFNREVEEDTAAHHEQDKAAVVDGLRPGDDFNARGPDWAAILEPHGWTCVRRSGTLCHWKRPGKKERGCSATTGYCSNERGHDLLAVFSTNAHPFRGPTGDRLCSCDTKFGAHALLNHGGDFSAAARELARQGYGSSDPHVTIGKPAPESLPATIAGQKLVRIITDTVLAFPELRRSLRAALMENSNDPVDGDL